MNGDSISSTINEAQLKETSDFMYKLLLAIGIVVMFIVGTVIGIQFMLASAEDKAKVKEALVPYVVGCIVIFGAFTIWSIAVNIGQNILPESSPSATSKYTTYSTGEDGKEYCDYCGDEIGSGDKSREKCSGCGKKLRV